MQVPIACLLEDDEARSQLAEWRRLLAHRTVEAESRHQVSPSD